MSRKIQVDLNSLKSYKVSFDNEKQSYMYNAYNTFSSGYISNCSDKYVQRMRANLSYHYNGISESYSNINAWWTNYNNDLECLENGLLNNKATATGIKESSVIASVNELPKLLEFNIDTLHIYEDREAKGLELKNHYSQKAIPIQNTILLDLIYSKNGNPASTLDALNDSVNSYLNREFIEISFGNEKKESQGLKGLFKGKYKDDVDNYNLDKLGVEYYDIKKIIDNNTGLIQIVLTTGNSIVVDTNNNSYWFKNKSGDIFVDVYKFGVKPGDIKSASNDNGYISFEMKDGNRYIFDNTTQELITIVDSKKNIYFYNLYKLDQYGITPENISSISKKGDNTYIVLKNGQELSINSTNELTYYFDKDGNDLKYIYTTNELSKYGISITDISSIDKTSDGMYINLNGKDYILVNPSTHKVKAILIGNNWYLYNNDHIYASNVAPNIFRTENKDNIQFGGSQMDFLNHTDDLLKNPDIMRVLKTYYPDANMEDYELLLHKLCNCGCGYTACINAVFNIYEGREEDFYNDFGFSMYDVKTDGSVDYNYEPLILSYFIEYWHDKRGYSIENIYGNIAEVTVGDESQSDVESTGATGTVPKIKEYLEEFLERRNAEKIDVKTFEPNSILSADDFKNIMENNPNSSVIIGAEGYDLYYINEDGTRGTIGSEDGGAHAMIIVRIENDEIIVSSWGKEYILDLENVNVDELFRYTLITPVE